jgi:hypothetical protein
MPTSQARIEANQRNALLSTGPRTESGKRASSRNSYQHGLASSGVILDDATSAELERRHEALVREMAPRTELGALLVRKIAVSSVVSELASQHEFAATAERVRNAPERFDAERRDRAENLLETIHANPRSTLRKLRALPEGIDLMIAGWLELKADVTRAVQPVWTTIHLIKAAHLLGIREDDARGSRMGVISDAIGGDFRGLAATEGGGLKPEARQGWARTHMAEWIDRIIEELERQADTLDYAKLELDRAEAAARALFDDSKSGTLARRYEADANRNFYKALKEFRAVEAEAAANPATRPTPSPLPSPFGSFREEDEDGPWPVGEPPEHLRMKNLAELVMDHEPIDEDGNPICLDPTLLERS